MEALHCVLHSDWVVHGCLTISSMMVCPGTPLPLQRDGYYRGPFESPGRLDHLGDEPYSYYYESSNKPSFFIRQCIRK